MGLSTMEPSAAALTPCVTTSHAPTHIHTHTYTHSVAEAFYAKLKQRAQTINVGDPMQPGCRLGPVVSAAQYERVRNYVQVRQQHGYRAHRRAGDDEAGE